MTTASATARFLSGRTPRRALTDRAARVYGLRACLSEPSVMQPTRPLSPRRRSSALVLLAALSPWPAVIAAEAPPPPLACRPFQEPKPESKPAKPQPPKSAPEADALVLPEFASGEPRFRKLIYGVADEKPAVWVVVDGTDVLCDINRNGDLTEPGERQSYDGRTAHFEGDGVEVWYHKNLVKSKYQGIVQGRLFPPSSKDAASAPVFHIAGPLAVLKQEFRNRLGSKLDDFLIYVNIGTEYPGVERTSVRYECVARRVAPRLRILYGDDDVAELTLKSRC